MTTKGTAIIKLMYKGKKLEIPVQGKFIEIEENNEIFTYFTDGYMFLKAHNKYDNFTAKRYAKLEM